MERAGRRVGLDCTSYALGRNEPAHQDVTVGGREEGQALSRLTDGREARSVELQVDAEISKPKDTHQQYPAHASRRVGVCVCVLVVMT